MNKSDLIHEIFLFDKEIADYGIKKRVLLTNNYLLDKGMLYRKYNSEEISASSLTDENKEKELLAFYEVFSQSWIQTTLIKMEILTLKKF